MRRRVQPGTWVQCNLRIRESQRRELAAAAKANRIPFQEEVRRRLTESFQLQSLDSFLYKLGMIAAAQSEKHSAGSIVGDAIKEAREAQRITPQQSKDEKAEGEMK
jgi:hypothetical protein